MNRFVLLFLLAATPAQADECDMRATSAATEVGAPISPRTKTGFILEYRKAETFRLDCMGGQVSRVSGTRLSSDPVHPFVQKVAQITSIALAVDKIAVTKTLLRCMRQAGDSGRVQKLSDKQLEVECLVLVNDLTFFLERRP